MASLNKWQGIGNVGKDPETKYAPNGTMIMNFSLATSKKWKEGEEWKEKTQWHNIAVFGKLCENIKLVKGDVAYIEGEIQNNEYTDGQGNKHYSYNITAQVVKFIAHKAVKQEDQAPQEDGAL